MPEVGFASNAKDQNRSASQTSKVSAIRTTENLNGTLEVICFRSYAHRLRDRNIQNVPIGLDPMDLP